jgi:hypothetical protein
LGDDERLANVEMVQHLVDDALCADVLRTFQQMHATRMAAMSRTFPVQETEIFEEII